MPDRLHIGGGVVHGTLAAFYAVCPTPAVRGFGVADDQLPVVGLHTPDASAASEDTAYSVLAEQDSGGAFDQLLGGSLHTNAAAFFPLAI